MLYVNKKSTQANLTADQVALLKEMDEIAAGNKKAGRVFEFPEPAVKEIRAKNRFIAGSLCYVNWCQQANLGKLGAGQASPNGAG